MLLLWSLLLLLLHQCCGDLAGDRNQLLRFYDAVRSSSSDRRLGWNRSSSSSGPCDWRGVECATVSNQLRVYKLRLPGLGLSGAVPEASLSSLTALRVLSLRSNRLSGPFPDVSNCSELRALYLQGNRFSGRLPPDFSFWPQLIHLNLAFNSLNGSIPATINALGRLGSLNLENNTLSGGLSPQLNLPRLRSFSIANNNISGPVPISLQGFDATSFLGNIGICGRPLSGVPCPGSPSPAPGGPQQQREDAGGRRKKRKLSGGAIAGIVLGSVAVAAILLLCCWLCLSRKRKQAPQVIVRSKFHQSAAAPGAAAAGAAAAGDSSKELESYSSSRDIVPNKLYFFDASRRSSYDLEDLLRASAEVLGKGGIGTTYKAVLEDGSVVAVKRLKEVTTSREQFEQQMQIVGGFRHRNIVPLRAYYFSKDEKLLVSDYMPRGSLSALLHGNRGAGRTPLDWAARIRIAYGAAKGLAHLHDHPSGFVHGSIKSSNILLAKDFEACISDAGLVHLLNTPAGSSSKVVGYRAPEVAETRRPTQKSDVYSYGVVLLELLTGRAPGQASLNDEGIDLPRWVQSVVREEWTAEVFDLELMRYENIEDDLVQMLQLALNCTSASPDHRPTMKQAVNLIQELGARNDVDEQRTSDPSDDRSTSDVSESR